MIIQNKTTNKLLIVLICLISALFVYLLFGQWLKMVWRANNVLGKASASGVMYYYLRCEENNYPGDNLDAWKKCADISEYYKIKATKEWEPLIKKYQEINCSDFLYSNDAQEFYEYYGGGTSNAILKSNKDGLEDSYGRPLSWKNWMDSFVNPDKDGNILFNMADIEKRYHYDPYNLDADNDESVCEQLPQKTLNERDQPWRDWNNKM